MDVLAKYVTNHPLVAAPVATFTREGIVMRKRVAQQVAFDTLKVKHLRGNPAAKQVRDSRDYLKQFIN